MFVNIVAVAAAGRFGTVFFSFNGNVKIKQLCKLPV